MSANVPGVDNRGPVVLAVTAGVATASTCFVLLRVISRLAIVRRVSWSDYFMILAWVRAVAAHRSREHLLTPVLLQLLAVGLSFSICYGTSRGLGLHDVNILPEWRVSLTRSEYVFSVLYNPALMATKTSILAFYLNLSKVQPMFKWASIATLIVVNAAGLALTVLNIYQCAPLSDVFEDPLPSSAHCIDIVTLYLSSAPVNIITDLAILFLPMPILTGMHLPRKQKSILVLTFALGGFVAIVDVVRIAYLEQAWLSRAQDPAMTSARIGGRDDFGWYASLAFMWSAVEVNVGIICACIPTLKPLISRVLPRMLHDVDEMNPYCFARRLDGSHVPPLGSTAAERLHSHAEGEKPTPGGATDAAAHEDRVTPLPPAPPDVVSAQRMPSHPSEASTAVSPKGYEMDMIDFLTTPDMTELPPRARRAEPAPSGTASSPFYDFVNPTRPKSMMSITTRQSYFPMAMVTILFFMWGFAYGLLDALNVYFQSVILGAESNPNQQTGLHSAYWAGYFVGPPTIGRLVLRRWGFKATFITGLCIYACGTLIFWPSAVLGSFPAFALSNFVVGTGLATLETAANPFIFLCGPPQYADARLNFAQGVQAIGGVVSPLLAQLVIFRPVEHAFSSLDTQWAYLSIALFDIVLAVVFYYLPLPEASDEELDEAQCTDHGKVGGVNVMWVTLGLGVFAQFCYVGAQETLATAFTKYVDDANPRFVEERSWRADLWLTPRSSPILVSFNCRMIALGCFAAGRFLAALLSVFVNSRWILAFAFLGSIVTSSLAMHTMDNTGATMVILATLFESAIWPLVFAISLRGMGSYTKTAATLLTAAASGGGIFPAVAHAVFLASGIQEALAVVVALYAFGAVFPTYLNLVPAARTQVDHIRADDSVHALRRRRTSRALSGLTWWKQADRKFSDLEHLERQSTGT
ncbi:MAG: hypothetical protein M1838_000339 [Thelocarpon superellum]|nr:MAG: hypothetical protein M1838_000339 [Thelocarpon superellum]